MIIIIIVIIIFFIMIIIINHIRSGRVSWWISF